jgi:hypothetical protein
MKKCPDTVTMCLLKADMFSLKEEHVLGNFVMGHLKKSEYDILNA